MGTSNSKLEEELLNDFPPSEKLTGLRNVKKYAYIKFSYKLGLFKAWRNLLLQ